MMFTAAYQTEDVEAVQDGDALRLVGKTADEWVRAKNPVEIEQ